MSAAHPVVAPQTAAITSLAQIRVANAFFNTAEYDRVLFCANGTLGAGETIFINVVDSGGNIHALVQPAGAGPTTYSIVGGTNDTILVEGGPLYAITKQVTGGAVGVDAFVKPRSGFAGS